MSNAIVSSIRSVFGGNSQENPLKYKEGVVEYTKDIEKKQSEEEQLAVLSTWDDNYQKYYNKKIKNMQNVCINYYKGLQGKYVIGDQNAFSCDNIIFQCVETYIPQATRKNPEPVVSAKDIILQNELGETTNTLEISKGITIALNEIADSNGLVSEAKQMLRDWLQKFLGVFEVTFNLETGKPEITALDPLSIEMDSNGFIDSQGLFHGKYIKKICNTTASEFVEKYPSSKDFVTGVVKNEMGSSITYSKFITEDQVIIRFENKIIHKDINPYHTDKVEDRFVNSPFNFVFLAFFNDKTQPHDNTGLVWQVVPAQDKLNRLNEQIYKNMNQVNSSIRFDPDKNMTDAKAAQIINALERDTSYIVAPQGAFERIAPPVLGSEIFNLRSDLRNEIQSVFGVYGSMPSNIQAEKTVGGKIITKNLDESRIGGGITYQLEQVYDSVFNWCIQIMKLMMIEETEFIYEGEQTKFSGPQIPKPLIVSIKENSLIPRDPINDANLAIQMFQLGVIAPETLLKMVNFPNPQEAIDVKARSMQQVAPVPVDVPPMTQSQPVGTPTMEQPLQ